MRKRASQLLPVAAILSILPLTVNAAEPIDLRDLTNGDPYFYTSDQIVKEDDGQKDLVGVGRPSTTHSKIPHLPFYVGYVNTNYTYRFFTIAEQVLSMIGEGKHGLWRVQESGMIREYRKKDAAGLPANSDIMDAKKLASLESEYSSFLPDESWSGYKYPDQKFTADGRLNYIDLPITHPKYKARYAAHDPIDLPNFFCTMSEADYPYAAEALHFAFAQPGANQVGPLGKRAGLDIRENYTNVLRLQHFPDARTWANVGQEGMDALHVNWKAIDTGKTKAEYYLVERPFFNKPYLFLLAVFDNDNNDDFRYVRPDGPYFQSLGTKAKGLKTEVTAAPRFNLEDGHIARAIGLPVYGVHHPNRAAYGGGGACPMKGGDWGRYPDTSGGSGWATQYEEVTPMCDAVLLDVKFYSNLDGRDWSEPTKYLANAGAGSKSVVYKVTPGEYGVFSDPYNVAHQHVNQDATKIPSEITLVYPVSEKPVGYTPVPPLLHKPSGPVESTSCRQANFK
ncbi:hypothetical protein HYPP_04443 [Hyphomicrobium sp. ghe19]|nr:hypothetical protein HYPP_04443 [Hyphomicrobium sp. ghe19]